MTDHKRTYSQRGDDYLIEAQKVCKKNEPVQVVHCKECAWKANRPPEGHTLRPDADGYCLVHGHDVTFGEFCSSGESVGEKEKPKCPYCGHKMVHQYVYGDHFYRCPKCHAVAPDKETEAEAYEAAMQRWQEPNRVLTLGEVQNLAYVRYEQQHILVVEYRAIIKGSENVFRPCVIAHDRMRMVEIWEIYDGARMTLMEKSMYGKNWRCWLRQPTQKEMEDTPWMNQ